jgi:hypothetical protein
MLPKGCDIARAWNREDDDGIHSFCGNGMGAAVQRRHLTENVAFAHAAKEKLLTLGRGPRQTYSSAFGHEDPSGAIAPRKDRLPRTEGPSDGGRHQALALVGWQNREQG